MTSRRQFLAALGTGMVGVAGCLSGPGPRRAPDPWSERNVTATQTEDGSPIDRVNGHLTLRRGEFATYEFGNPDTAISFTLTASSVLALPFDVIMLRRETLSRFAAGDQVDPLSSGTASKVIRTHYYTRLPAGDYVVVFDNSKMGGSRPLDQIEITFEMSLEY